MKPATRHLPVAMTAAASLAMLGHGPIAQLPHYHDFADHSMLLGIPHAGDVLSNTGFALVATWGLRRLTPMRTHPLLARAWPGYLLFLLSLLLTALGSAFYHLAPDNARLVWDRLPIALACAGLLAGARADAVQHGHCARDTLILALGAVASVAWWALTDRYGAGDLRPYLLIQTLPLLLVPAWQLAGRAPARERRAFGAALLLYCLAKAAELADRALHDALVMISGHTLKHLLATVSAALIVARLVERTTSQQAPSPVAQA